MNIVWKGLDCCSVLVALWVSFSLCIYLLFANAAKTAGGGGVHSSTQRGSGVPLCLAEAPLEFAAADAWADENSVGIGGWWWPSGCAATPSSARWFSIQFERADLPTWFCSSESSSWQACISAFEALVQLVLLCLRCQFCDRHGSHVLKLAQLCDNLGVTYSTFKMLSMKQPLCFVLQADSSIRFPLLPTAA